MGRKIRQCPKCKSKQGFHYTYTVKGHGEEKRDFYGKVKDAERCVVDYIDHYSVYCLNCGKSLDSSKLEI